MIRIPIHEETTDTVCAGAQAGRDLLGKMLAQIGREPSAAEPIFLDFEGVEVATVSFLRESVLAFRQFVRGRKSNYYPVVANPNEIVHDELDVILSLRGEAILTCRLESDGTVTNVQLLGRLDRKQEQVFRLIEDRGETDASELQREFGEAEGVQQTAWNNRLAGLANAGLVAEVSQGRSKRYTSLFGGA